MTEIVADLGEDIQMTLLMNGVALGDAIHLTEEILGAVVRWCAKEPTNDN